MAYMTVIYKVPKNRTAFENHYYTLHVPLAKLLPGLWRYETSKGNILSPTGNIETFFIEHLHFNSLDAIQNAFSTEIGKRYVAERKILVPGNEDVQMYLYDTVDL